MKEDTPAPTWTYGTSWNGCLVEDRGCWRAAQTPFPLELAFTEINKALDAGLFYLALVVTLSVPDVCARLELPPDRIVRERHYCAWMEEYFLKIHGGVNTSYAALHGVDFFRMRCGMVHESSLMHRNTKFTHIIFYARKPGDKDKKYLQSSLSADGDLQSLVFQLDTAIFCRHMMEAARVWYHMRNQQENVRINLPNLVRFRPNGYPPFCDVPVIA